MVVTVSERAIRKQSAETIGNLLTRRKCVTGRWDASQTYEMGIRVPNWGIGPVARAERDSVLNVPGRSSAARNAGSGFTFRERLRRLSGTSGPSYQVTLADLRKALP